MKAKRKRFSLSGSTPAALALSLTSGCAIDPGERTPRDIDAVPTERILLPSDVEQACFVVGLLDPECGDPSTCPTSCPLDIGPGWTPVNDGTMFSSGTNALAALAITADDLPPTLRRFCFYEGVAGIAAPPPVQGMRTSLDCPVVAGQSSDATEALQSETQAAFEAHAGGAPSAIATGPSMVRVAIVDQHSTRSGSSPTSLHPTAMEGIVSTLACGTSNPEACGVVIDHALALPLAEDGSSNDPGDGFYGARGHLAIGIFEAVRAWMASGVGEPLVINLSLGWSATNSPPNCSMSEANPWCLDHTTDFSAFVTETTAAGVDYPTEIAVEAVHAALMYATCNGALVIAAAGNASDDSCNTRPLAPAIWSAHQAPSANDCHLLGFDTPAALLPRVPPDASVSWPLVTPVAALAHNNLPLGSTRPGSQTVLMAAGDHATVAEGVVPVTGSSVSAATTSAVAALVLSHAPSMSPGGVTSHLRAQGRPTGLLSQMPMYQLPAGTKVRQVAACRSIPGAPSCSITQYNTRLAATLTTLRDAVDAAMPALIDETIALDQASPVEDTCQRCSHDVDVLVPEDPQAPQDAWYFRDCQLLDADFEFGEGLALAGPQPDVPICTQCPGSYTASTGELDVDITVDSRFTDPSIVWHAANLKIVHGSGTTMIDLASLTSLSLLSSGATVRLKLGTRFANPKSIRMNAQLENATGPFVAANDLQIIRR